ncbi:MAG: hypothetical protein ACKVPX_00195 [Myxococcaceae bacterium]
MIRQADGSARIVVAPTVSHAVDAARLGVSALTRKGDIGEPTSFGPNAVGWTLTDGELHDASRELGRHHRGLSLFADDDA